MEKLWFAICWICYYLEFVSALEECPGGVKCIPINKCTVGYDNIKLLQFQKILRSLSCGFEGDVAYVCCPPTFLNPSNRGNLLPNTSVCGIQTAERIYGGVNTEIDEHPWMALLRYDKPRGSGFYCGGVLISSRYVLTAAHCIKGSDIPPNWKLSEVRLGEWNLTSDVDCVKNDCNLPVINVPIEKVIPHEDYKPKDGSQQNDIALIRLDRDVKFTDFVKPICLPIGEELQKNSFNGWDLEVAGWGKTEKRSMSDVKLKVTLPVVQHQECKDVYASASRIITDKQMCAGGWEGQDSCRGDSGGSLMGQATKNKNWFAFGVVSFGPSPCGTKGWPGVYTRVTAFSNWILSNLEP